MSIDRTPEELAAYVERLEELAWKNVGHCDAYEALMEDPPASHLVYVEALEKLILTMSQVVDRPVA